MERVAEKAGETSRKLSFFGKSTGLPCNALVTVADAAHEAYQRLPAEERRQADDFECMVLAKAQEADDTPGLDSDCPQTTLGKTVRESMDHLDGTCNGHRTPLRLPLAPSRRLSSAFRTASADIVARLEQTLVSVLQAIRAKCCSVLAELLPLRSTPSRGTLSGRSTDLTPVAVACGVLRLTQFVLTVLRIQCEKCVQAVCVGSLDCGEATRRSLSDPRAQDLLALRDADCARVQSLQQQMLSVLKVLVAQPAAAAAAAVPVTTR
jgi:hypothetical protein